MPSEQSAFDRELNRSIWQDSLIEFLRDFWEVLEPGTPLIWGWHIGAICEHLQAVSDGQLKRLIINIPPGHMKSNLVSVMWPAWQWCRKPELRGLYSSYAHSLAIRDSVRCRMLIESEKFQEHFPEVKLSEDDNTKDKFSNTRMGVRQCISVGSAATGFRGDLVCVDDPINAIDIYSEVEREKCKVWWDTTMQTRVNNPETGAFVVIMQRLHEDDLTGHLLTQGGYEHLCLSSEFDTRRKCITMGGKWKDPRTVDGELLFPEMFSQTVLDELKKRLGPDAYAGQHDQLPVSATGNMFPSDWWQFWSVNPGTVGPRPMGCNQSPTKPLPLEFERVIISVDATFKGKVTSDFVVQTVWGTKGPDRYLLDMRRGQMGFAATKDDIRALRKLFPRVREVFVEDKANGSAIIEDLTREMQGVIAVEPEGGKEARAAAIQPQVRSGNVYLPEGASWLAEFVSEFKAFPKGKHDDIVDSTSQALVQLQESSALQRLKMLAQR